MNLHNALYPQQHFLNIEKFFFGGSINGYAERRQKCFSKLSLDTLAYIDNMNRNTKSIIMSKRLLLSSANALQT